MKRLTALAAFVSILCAIWIPACSPAAASGGSGGGGGGSTTGPDTIKVSKCYYSASGTVLLMASSSDATAHIYVYRSSGQLIGEVQNGGGGRYGGTVFYVGLDPVVLTFLSTKGGSVTVPTAPFQL